jgi:hypothetical protein
MRLCEACQKASNRLRDSLTRMERIHLLAAATAMAGTIHHGRGSSQEIDRIVNSSVVTKLIYSLEPEAREPMLRYFQQTVGLDIVVDSCPHGKLNVV